MYTPLTKIFALGLIFCMPLKRAKTHSTAYNKHVLTIKRGEIKKKVRFTLPFEGSLWKHTLLENNCPWSRKRMNSFIVNTFKYHVFAPMGRFQLELFYLYFPPSFHQKLLFLSCRPFVVITTLSTGLVRVEVTSVSWLGQLTVGV